MKLYEILENISKNNSVLIELMLPYKKSLCTIFSREYKGEPILMVTSVSNAAQYGLICCANEFSEAIEEWLNDSDLSEEDKENERELISFQSIPRSKL